MSGDQDKWTRVVSSAEDHVRMETSGAPGERGPLPGRGALLVLSGIAVAVAIAIVAPRVIQGPPASLSSVEQGSDLRAEAGRLIEQIEAYRAERGVLPAPAMLAPFLDEGYEYRILDRTSGHYEVRHAGGGVEVVGKDVMTVNGHCTYLPGNEWILNDTYPLGEERLQTPHLYHVATGRRVDLGHFHVPKIYAGEWRVDSHPRISPDGRLVCIDAPHENEGRQLHLIDITPIVA